MITDPHLHRIIPVLPSADIARDVAWYRQQAGFAAAWHDDMYAVLNRGPLQLHLQWHADTESDPLLGGSVIRIEVRNIRPLFEEFVARGTVPADKFRGRTPWGTDEFGFYDLNGNAVFFMEDVKENG